MTWPPRPSGGRSFRSRRATEGHLAEVHRLEEKQAALCISGGGIRSASFALGILCGLARCGLLKRFHYLSTVSGGGYIGGWLTAWIHHRKEGLDGVSAELAQPRSEARPRTKSKTCAVIATTSARDWGCSRPTVGPDRNLPAQSAPQLDGHHPSPGRGPNDSLDLYRGPDDESPALFFSPALAGRGLRLGRRRLHGLEPALWP
ncbi:MAG: patatin-like phospholipase family protein [Chthoniobacterales bacterium]|nr:patatin-like phospholipase family protein [Chthoniobacterales bacterium]